MELTEQEILENERMRAIENEIALLNEWRERPGPWFINNPAVPVLRAIEKRGGDDYSKLVVRASEECYSLLLALNIFGHPATWQKS